MDPVRTGKFILQLRKEHGLTQKELADKISVTDKAVSKWECGRGFPDIGVLESLAGELGTSVTELVSGEKSTPETIRGQSDDVLIEMLLYVKRMIRKTIGTLMLTAGIVMLVMPLYYAGIFLPMFIGGAILTIGGVFMFASKFSTKSYRLPKRVCEFVSFGALAAALVLEALPNGVILWWAAPPGEAPHATFHSWFDPTLYGAAMFPPFITALLTIAVTVLSVIVIIAGKRAAKPQNALFVCLIVTAVISACPVLYGFKHVTVIGVLITLMLTLSAIFRAAANAKR